MAKEPAKRDERRDDPKNIMGRWEKAWQRKAYWRSLYSDAYALALPQRNPYYGGDGTNTARNSAGQSKMDKVFDSTLMKSTMRLSNRLQDELTPPMQKWGKIVPGPFVPAAQKTDALKRTEMWRDTFFAALRISTFDTSVGEFYSDLAIGNGVMTVEEGDDEMPVVYTTIPSSEVAWEDDPRGGQCAVFRKHTVKVRNIKRTWKAFDVKLTPELTKMMKDTPDKELEFRSCLYRSEDRGDWYYEVYWMQASRGGKSDHHCIVEDELDDNPYLITRWFKMPGEEEGRGPVLFALPDAKTLNRLKQLILMNASIAVSGVWTGVDDGVLNPKTVRIVPGAVIPVARNGGALGASLAPLKSGADFDVSQLLSEDLIMSIKEIMLDMGLPPESGPVRSATEIAERIRQLARDIGAPFGRLLSEFIRPLIEKSVNVLIRKGIIQVPEGKTIRINGGALDIEVLTPLAQTQNLADVDNVVKWLTIVKSMGDEAFFLGVKIEDVPNYLGEKMGVDANLMRSKDERSTMQGMAGKLLAMQGAGQAGGVMPTTANDNGGVMPVAQAA